MAKQIFKFIYGIIPFKRQIYNFIKKFWTPPEGIIQYLRFKGIYKTHIDDIHSFLFRNNGTSMEAAMFWNGGNATEPISMSLWSTLSKKADIIFDIGANIGMYALVSKCINPTAQLYAFEPFPGNFDKLADNIKINHFNITCIDKAVSNNDGKTNIYFIPLEKELSAMSSLNQEFLPTGAKHIEVKTIKIKTFIEENNIQKIDLMKIDVETHEPEVLEGFEHYLDKFRLALLIEILKDEIGQRVEELLKDKDYLYFNINEKTGSIRQVEHITKSDSLNYLFCNKQIAKELKLNN